MPLTRYHQADSRRNSQVTLHILMLVRWLGISMQMAALIATEFWLKYDLPYAACYLAVGLSVLLNGLGTSVALSGPSGGRAILSYRATAMYLLFDIAQIGLLLHFAGGIDNPFSVLILAPVIAGAALLPALMTFMLVLATVLTLGLLTVVQHPMPWSGALPPVHLVRRWSSLTLATVCFSAYVWYVTRERSRILDALAAGTAALNRAQKLNALGALAAAAAHELGTPLSTILVVAGELASQIPSDSPYAEDVALLRSQAIRCRDILAALVSKPDGNAGGYQPIVEAPLSHILQEIAAPYLRPDVDFSVIVQQTEHDGGDADPFISRSPEFVHGLGNLLHNSLQFASSRVVVTIARDEPKILSLRISDDGPGFSRDLLARLGEPYLSTRHNMEGHMGLGIFIAETMLERMRAKVYYDNRPEGGAEITIRWPWPLEEETRKKSLQIPEP